MYSDSWKRSAALAIAGCLAVLGIGAGPADAAKNKRKGPSSPNILFVVTDDQRARGTLDAMPRTRSLFSRRSTEYTQAHVSTPLCCPSRSTIFSGLYAHNHGVWFHDGHFADQDRTMQRWLKQAGYRTGLIGKFLNRWPVDERPPYWSKVWLNAGSHSSAQWNSNGRVRRVRGNSTTFAGEQAKRFIKSAERKDRRPWFLYVATSEPHGPLTPKPKYRSRRFGPMPMSPAQKEADLSDKPRFLREQADGFAAASQPIEEVRLAQLQLLQGVDELVGSLVRNLRRTGEVRDTLIVFVSDNGLHWGEHGGFVVKDLPYEASTHVPLLIRWPANLAKGRPRKDRRLVSNVDLAPTVFDVARVSRSHKADGRSLRHKGWNREHLLLEYGGFRGNGFVIPPWAALRSERDLFVQYEAAAPYEAESEYYGLASDPWELRSNPAAAPPALSGELANAVACRGPRNCP